MDYTTLVVLDDNKTKWSMMLSMAQQVASNVLLSPKQETWLRNNFKGSLEQFKAAANCKNFISTIEERLKVKNPFTVGTTAANTFANSPPVQVDFTDTVKVLNFLLEKSTKIVLSVDNNEGINYVCTAVPTLEIEKLLHELEKANN